MKEWVLLPTGHSMSSGIILKKLSSSFQRRSDMRWKRRSNSRGYRLGRSSIKLRKGKVQESRFKFSWLVDMKWYCEHLWANDANVSCAERSENIWKLKTAGWIEFVFLNSGAKASFLQNIVLAEQLHDVWTVYVCTWDLGIETVLMIQVGS